MDNTIGNNFAGVTQKMAIQDGGTMVKKASDEMAAANLKESFTGAKNETLDADKMKSAKDMLTSQSGKIKPELLTGIGTLGFCGLAVAGAATLSAFPAALCVVAAAFFGMASIAAFNDWL
jgi:hypothetical protein